MAIAAKDRKKEYEKDQNELFAMLDKGIADMRSGRTIEHDEAMRIIREKLAQYDV
ncbi:Uncharacterised protein [[Eubacterium] contortum]|uniref:Uncharacterized protein n=1 Tax=Faecalicatena contorta TaxID=39482 RepID=A0A174B014_9FIRM|nr:MULTISPECIES: hypothetical protein [Clostridia]CUN93110.1 Uncharacterised protein [[Eubacterium] contortum] [Faecalicatena contorta]